MSQDNKNKEGNSKPWYKNWWGIILIIALWPFVILYLVWAKTNWDKKIKIGITALLVILFIFGMTASTQNEKEALNLVSEAEAMIQEGQLNEASTTLEDSKEIYSTDEASELLGKIKKTNSENYLKESLISMSDKEAKLLKEGELEKSFIEHKELNEIFVKKLKNNLENRERYISEREEKIEQERKEAEAQRREEKIEDQFSSWNGSHRQLTKVIKESMHNPDSYEHVETSYKDMGDYLIVRTKFRGTNGFGAVVTNNVEARVSLDGQVLEITSDY